MCATQSGMLILRTQTNAWDRSWALDCEVDEGENLALLVVMFEDVMVSYMMCLRDVSGDASFRW